MPSVKINTIIRDASIEQVESLSEKIADLLRAEKLTTDVEGDGKMESLIYTTPYDWPEDSTDLVQRVRAQQAITMMIPTTEEWDG